MRKKPAGPHNQVWLELTDRLAAGDPDAYSDLLDAIRAYVAELAPPGKSETGFVDEVAVEVLRSAGPLLENLITGTRGGRRVRPLRSLVWVVASRRRERILRDQKQPMLPLEAAGDVEDPGSGLDSGLLDGLDACWNELLPEHRKLLSMAVLRGMGPTAVWKELQREGGTLTYDAVVMRTRAARAALKEIAIELGILRDTDANTGSVNTWDWATE